MTMRRLALVLLSATLVLSTRPVFTRPAQDPGPAELALRQVKARIAPDRRLVVFDVRAEPQPDAVIASGEVEGVEARDAALKALRGAVTMPVVDQIAVLPDPALGSDTFGIIRVSVANVRSKPSHAAEMGTQTVMGWTVRVLKRQSGWYLVHTDPDGYLGWIEELQLSRVTPGGKRAWETAPRVICTAPVATVRQAAAAHATPVADLVAGGILERTGVSGGWVAVKLADGRKGYVAADDVQDLQAWTASRAPSGDSVEQSALQFMGVPYLWGGTSSKGFDCSGFTKTVFRLNGIELPRDTDQQAGEGTEVVIGDGLSRLQKGDLLFFGTRAAAGLPERVSHVGIHVGRLEFIHASGLVRRNSLDAASPIYSESLRNRLLHVRRIINDGGARPR